VPGTTAFGRVIAGVVVQLRDVHDERTALKILTIVGAGSAFPTSGHLVAYAGLAPVTRRAYYDRKRAEGKKHSAALSCLARRRTDVLHALLRDRVPYRHPSPTSPPPPPLDTDMGALPPPA
jgi:hypothetical protein